MRCFGLAKVNFILAFLILSFPGSGLALLPSEVLVIANSNVSDSVKLARYYMEKRGIPKENLLKIKTAETEDCSRESYDEDIAKPVREKVAMIKNIKALVTVYGVPLKAGRPKLSPEEQRKLNLLIDKSREIQARMKELSKNDSKSKTVLGEELSEVYRQITIQKKNSYSAAVDSELALVLNPDYDIEFWLKNPYFVGYRGQTLDIRRNQVLFVSRLDGPSVDLVRRIIDDSLVAEKTGLSGKAYLDAKRPRNTKKQLDAMAFYDHSLHLAGDRIKDRNQLSVVIDEKGTLFQPGDAPDAALYCGWYSYAKYIDAFDWKQGAVGYHIASVECATLRSGKSQFWCKRMLEDGAAAVIGPVDEPYVQAFPVPETFFYFLTDGYYTLVEAYFLSLPYLSWQMVLVGDPLYRPFKNTSQNQ